MSMPMQERGSTARVGMGWGRFATWISRLILILPALILLRVGFRYIVDPAHAANPSGVVLSTPEALTDTRVTGGIVLTVVLMILWTLSSPDKLRIGHGVVMALMFTVLAVRIFGFAQDGTTLAMGTERVKTIGETVFLVLNTIGLVVQTLRASGRSGTAPPVHAEGAGA